MISLLKKFFSLKNPIAASRNRASGFTLVELLIVVGILVTISTAAVMVINPAELIKQSNDSKRLADIAALDKSLSLYRVDNTGVLASTSTVYLSLPDTSSTCASYALPALASPYVYHCATIATAPRMDGTGWIPVNLSNLSGGTPLSHLPQDPMNNASYYDAFIPGSDGSYVLTTKLESQKYLMKATADGGYDATRAETGSPVLWATATNLLDVTNPTVQTFSPADNATNASISADFTITFAEAVQVGTGNITLKKTDGTLIEAMDVTNPFRVSGSGSTTITINPTANLAYSTGYYVLIDATAFDDLAGNSYAGIADSSTWNFTTGAQPDTTPPTAQTFSPADNATNISQTENLVITFSEAVTAMTGANNDIVIKKTSDNSTIETIDAQDAKITGSGTNTITIDPAATLTYSTEYYVLIGVDAFDDLASNSYAGIASTTAWSFTIRPWTCGDLLIDTRDSQTYSTHTYGTACWMAQNLNYGTYTAVASSQSLGQKFCQNYSGVNDPTCPIGGLYQWATAMNGAASCNGTGAGQPACSSPVQGICPSGWHVPSHYEWTYLEKQVGSNPNAFLYDESTSTWLGTDEGINLKESGTSHWSSGNNGTNTSGFTALPGGAVNNGSFTGVRDVTWMTSSTRTSGDVWWRYMGSTTSGVLRNKYGPTFGPSLRCVKN